MAMFCLMHFHIFDHFLNYEQKGLLWVNCPPKPNAQSGKWQQMCNGQNGTLLAFFSRLANAKPYLYNNKAYY